MTTILEFTVRFLKKESILNIAKPLSGSSNKLLYKISTTQNMNYWLKVYPEEKKFRQELNAFKIMEQHDIKNIPELIGFSDNKLYCLLLTECSGTIICDQQINTSQSTDVFYKAGIFLKHLHAIPPETEDSLSPLQALSMRLTSLERNNKKSNLISKDFFTRAKSLLNELDSSSHLLKRGLSHRDFSPRNWLYSNNGIFAVIDFEHTLFDITLLDITRLNAHYFIKTAGLKTAFFSGYSNALISSEYEKTLNILTYFYGLQTLLWGKRYNEAEFIALGNEALSLSGKLL